jgi:trimeric autotransporter adhesin
VKNLYDGNVATDASGEAIVTLPTYFEALNRDFRYQLTVIGQFAQAIVSSEIKGNQFVIKTDKPNVKVSWQVTGIRQDAYTKAHPMVVEQEKPANERGTYQHPELFGQPEQKGLFWARNSELRKRQQAKPIQQESSQKTGGQ